MHHIIYYDIIYNNKGTASVCVSNTFFFKYVSYAAIISNNIYLGKMAAIIFSKIVKPLIKCPFTGVQRDKGVHTSVDTLWTSARC